MRGEITEKERYKILLIEDDEIDQMSFRRLVEQQQLPYDYRIAGCLSQAKDILSSEIFDIVIADYSLGDGTAFDVLSLTKDVPVIFATGAGDEEIAVKAMKAGAYDYLIKDIERCYLKTVPVVIEHAIKHKNAEDKLRLLSGAIMSTDDSVYITDMDDKIIFVNKAFCKTYGYREAEILRKDSNILWIGKNQSANTRSVFRTQGLGGSWEIGFYHKRKDGSIFPVSLSRSIIKDSKGNKVAVVGTIRDITERILVEEELRKANLKLKQESYEKCQLGIMILETLERMLSDENIDIVQMQEKGIRGLLEKTRITIRNFRDIIRIDTGTMSLELEQASLRSIVQEVVEITSPLAKEKGIKLESVVPAGEAGFETASGGELLFKGDHERIRQVLINIICYCIDSAKTNGHIQVLVKDVGDEFIVQVQDDGSSIEGHVKEKISNFFEWTKDQIHQTNGQELSLGLPLAKKLIEMHNGMMWVESRDKQGKNFCFSLPKQSECEAIPKVTRALETHQQA